MRTLKSYVALLAIVAFAALAGCTMNSNKAADVTASIRTGLTQAGLKDVSVSQDRDKGIVTLGGHVAVADDKSKAETIARTFSGQQVVANEIAIVPVGGESAANTMNSDLDQGIEKNLDAALVGAKLHKSVHYAVKNHVVTLTGDVRSQAERDRAGEVATGVPNVQQVVNTLQIKAQKATSSST